MRGFKGVAVGLILALSVSSTALASPGAIPGAYGPNGQNPHPVISQETCRVFIDFVASVAPASGFWGNAVKFVGAIVVRRVICG